MQIIINTEENNNVPWSVHTAHNHIVNIVDSYLNRYEKGKVIRILDVGFGSGKLICHLLNYLKISKPSLQFEVFGLDVYDSGVQDVGFIDTTKNYLANQHPDIRWNNNLIMIYTKDKWPFEDNSFDFILSNVVIEHVFDINFLINEIKRCLNTKGININLFPTREVLWEGHIHMPIVHKVRNEKLRSYVIYTMAKMGFKKCYYFEMQRRGWKSIKEFALVFSKVLETDTNYITQNEFINLSRCNGLDISFKYTKDFYITKIMSILGKKYIRYKDWGRIENIVCIFLRYISAITVTLTKK